MQNSLNVALHIGKWLLEALPNSEKYSWTRLGRAAPFSAADSFGDVESESVEGEASRSVLVGSAERTEFPGVVREAVRCTGGARGQPRL